MTSRQVPENMKFFHEKNKEDIMSDTARNSFEEYFSVFPPVPPSEFPIFGKVPVGTYTLDQLSRKMHARGVAIKEVNHLLQGVQVTRAVKVINLICIQPLDLGFVRPVSYKVLLKRASTDGLVLCPRETAFQVFISEDTRGLPKKHFDLKECSIRNSLEHSPIFLFATAPVDVAIVSTQGKMKGRIEALESHIFGICVECGVMKVRTKQVSEKHELPPDIFMLFQKNPEAKEKGYSV